MILIDLLDWVFINTISKDKITRLGGKFLSLKDDFESETPQSKLLENIKVSIAEYEREHNQERVNSRMRARLNEDSGSSIRLLATYLKISFNSRSL